MTKREKLARVLWRQNIPMNLNEETREALWRKDKTLFLGEVDAILDAMMEPSEEMLEASRTIPGEAGEVTARFLNVRVGETEWGPKEIWQAMLRAIREE